MKRTLLLAACAALLASPAVAQSSDEGRRLVEAGQAAFQTGDYARAAQILWDATMADTAVRDDAQLQILRGRAVMRSGRPENAIRIFELIGGSAEAYADAMYWRGEALMLMTEPGEAADSYREALRFNPDHALAQARLSSLPPGISTPVAVEAPLIDSAPVEEIEVEPAAPVDAAPAPEVSAPASLRPAPPEPPEMEETPEADASPGIEPSNLEQGRAAFADGEWSDAAAYLWRASQDDPAVRNDNTVQLMRAEAVMRSGRPDAAIVVFDEVAATAAPPLAAQALYLRGEAQAALGRDADAEASWREALARQPGQEDAQARLAALAPEPASEPEPVQLAETAPEPESLQAARLAPEPAPAPSADGEMPSSAQQQEAMAAEGRANAEAARAAGDRAGEALALSRVYLSQLATDEEIERYAELTEGAVSADPVRDFEIAQLASYAGFGAHNRLSAALYRAVEAAGGLAGRNLAVLKANLGTVMLQDGDPQAALAEAEAALAADDTYANGWAVRSLAKQELGDLGGALEDAKQAYDRGVMSPPVLALLQAAGFAVTVPATPDEAALRGGE